MNPVSTNTTKSSKVSIYSRSSGFIKAADTSNDFSKASSSTVSSKLMNVPLTSCSDDMPISSSTAGYIQKVNKVAEAFSAWKDFYRGQMPIEVTGGEIYLEEYSPRLPTTKGVIFYIPGTASVAYNHEITKSIVTHLAHAQDATVFLVAHRLAPGNKWPTPFNDVMTGIRTYCESKKLSAISLAGYSSGGLLAVLALIDLRCRNTLINAIDVENVFLFSPMLDFSMEFHDLVVAFPLDQTLKFMSSDSIPDNYQKFKPCIGRLRKLALLNKDNRGDFELAKERSSHKKFLTKSRVEQVNKDCFSRKTLNDMNNLRQISSLWHLPEAYRGLNAKISVIIGGEDYLNIDALLFLEILRKAGLKPSYFELEGCDHTLQWNSLCQIYLTRCITAEKQVIRIPVDIVSQLKKTDKSFLGNSIKMTEGVRSLFFKMYTPDNIDKNNPKIFKEIISNAPISTSSSARFLDKYGVFADYSDANSYQDGTSSCVYKVGMIE